MNKGEKMENSEKDIRYQRTKNNILEALIDLLKKKNFDQITVKEICDKATISRSGFYLHYTDKYDLVKKYQFELMRKGMTVFATNFGKNKRKMILEALNNFQHEGQLLGLLISKNGSSEIKEQVKQSMRENAQKNMLPYLKIASENETQRRYLLSFFSNAIFGVLQEWVDTGQKESPEELVSILENFFDPLIKNTTIH